MKLLSHSSYCMYIIIVYSIATIKRNQGILLQNDMFQQFLSYYINLEQIKELCSVNYIFVYFSQKLLLLSLIFSLAHVPSLQLYSEPVRSSVALGFAFLPCSHILEAALAVPFFSFAMVPSCISDHANACLAIYIWALLGLY
ncbi:Hypothetical_protein [Hexamita inflata]|uniref:Hypothetical_protein n=1 Tax=Hexamita inflata TaxID=28002 RepID=A0AA86RSF3_9EUKA|nr:Hypothetical protein HINF_LOCUS64822 [Hexamita inflata]